MFLYKEGVVKVGDYELAAQLDRTQSEREAVFGTTRYMAPEVFEGKTCLKSDVWSLGISLIEMAEGRNPFEGCSPLMVMKSVCEKDPPSLSCEKWSAACVDFVGKCLVKDVKERWSVSELMHVSCLVEE